ncbi:hypothetical protein RIVM261_019850 [Rivularia sp. IAM M-261]|nr:hypothetical protein CAL7716_027460 [Calothrix sp. PCC 7716]GJD17029.1 hypothetical protein RIVM261_019850 [Rivularia sp. IAM M-261]
MISFKQFKLKVNFVLGSLFYQRYAIQAYLYTRHRNASERNFKRPPTKEAFDNPGKLIRVEATPAGANFYFEQVELEP